MLHLVQRATPTPKPSSLLRDRQIEGREWWLWAFMVTVTLALTAGIIFLSFYGEYTAGSSFHWADPLAWVRGLTAFVLLFDIYTLYQHRQLQRVRRQLAERDKLFHLITEYAADMIAVVDNDGNRLYNSPAYQRVLGYSAEELGGGSAFDQIHPSDRERVREAASKARTTGQGQRLEYRLRHKDQSLRTLESTASPIWSAKGEIEGLVIVNRDITERKRAEELLEHNAFHDALTDLPNRALFIDRLQHALMRVRRRNSDYKFAVLFVDIDEFKVLNDSLGHSAGDELLVQIAKRLTVNFRDTDTLARSANAETHPNPDDLARLGGDEFTVLLEDIVSASDAIRVADRVQARIALPFDIKGQQIVISASVGIALSSSSYASAEDVLRDSEIAMYRAKRAGKARCQVFDPAMHSSAVLRLKLETELRRGLEMGELVVYYQPIVSLSGGRIVGFEALSRWRHPQGLISPADFIPVADETGLILPLNRALLREACLQLKNWQSQLALEPPLTMSVNLSAKQFTQPDTANDIATILQETRVAPNVINFEIMETIAMSDADWAMRVLRDLKVLGVHLSIDDFGTGYSSLGRLPRLPIDALKIDRSFISNMTDHENREIVRTIITLAHSLNLKVVAEGTETEDQISELKQVGCEMAQGYFYSPPVSAQSAFDLLLRNSSAVSGGNTQGAELPLVTPTRWSG